MLVGAYTTTEGSTPCNIVGFVYTANEGTKAIILINGKLSSCSLAFLNDVKEVPGKITNSICMLSPQA